MKLYSYGKTDTGKKRTVNQDSFHIDKETNLYIVADGMGGGVAGDVASSTAVERVACYVRKNKSAVDSFVANPTPENKDVVLKILVEGVCEANRVVYDESVNRRSAGSMGSTFTMLMVSGVTGFMVHIGDSKLFMARKGVVSQLSTDHTIGQDYISKYGSAADTISGEIAGMLSKALGLKRNVNPEKMTFDILPEDRFLLCSDGLSRYLTTQNLPVLELGIFRAPAQEREDVFVKKAVNRLVDYAYDCGGEDNITAVMVSAVGHPSEYPVRSRGVLDKMELIKNATLFRTLAYEEILKVIAGAELRSVKKYEVLSTHDRNREEDYVFILLEGQLSLMKRSRHIMTLKPGTHIGSLSFFGEPYDDMTLFVDRSSDLLRINKSDLLKLISDSPEIGAKILWEFSRSLAREIRTLYFSME